MSFSTEVAVEFYGDSYALDISSKKPEILKILDEDGIHQDVYTNLAELFNKQKSTFNLHAAYCFDLLKAISRLFPQISFLSRGLGEEFIFTWVALFENGNITFKNLAWESENPLI